MALLSFAAFRSFAALFFQWLPISSTENDKQLGLIVVHSPVLTGILLYVMLLVPFLAVTTIAERRIVTLAALSASPFVIILTHSYACVFLFCVAAAIYTSHDALLLHYQRINLAFDVLLLLLAAAFERHIVLMGVQAALLREGKNCSLLLCSFPVASLLYVVAWRK